jgi:hypothetical protein
MKYVNLIFTLGVLVIPYGACIYGGGLMTPATIKDISSVKVQSTIVCVESSSPEKVVSGSSYKSTYAYSINSGFFFELFMFGGEKPDIAFYYDNENSYRVWGESHATGGYVEVYEGLANNWIYGKYVNTLFLPFYFLNDDYSSISNDLIDYVPNYKNLSSSLKNFLSFASEYESSEGMPDQVLKSFPARGKLGQKSRYDVTFEIENGILYPLAWEYYQEELLVRKLEVVEFDICENAEGNRSYKYPKIMSFIEFFEDGTSKIRSSITIDELQMGQNIDSKDFDVDLSQFYEVHDVTNGSRTIVP